jgi:hypothetical protein
MRVALGLKAHSGWAALVAIGADAAGFKVLDRRRIELAEDRAADWAGQPYHAADGLPLAQSRRIVEQGIEAARRAASAELKSAVERARSAGHSVVACAVVMPAPMPQWTIEQILAVHVRMHKAEGVLFPAALAHAASECCLQLLAIPEKELDARAESALARAQHAVAAIIARLGKSVGPPWGADQKKSALAATIALVETPCE